MKLKKILALVLSLVAVACISVTATVAYLSSTTSVVENTFTTGRVDITLDEKNVDENGDPIVDVTPDRDSSNEYKLFPGKDYMKDPTVHVKANSEDCWVFVKVDNGFFKSEVQIGEETKTNVNIEAADGDDMRDGEKYKTIANQIAENWTAVEGETGVYAYNAKVTKNADVQDLVVFEEFMISKNVDNDTLEAFKDAKIKVQAYAIQADGFDTAKAAWDASKATWGF